jgi:hypothetical protein
MIAFDAAHKAVHYPRDRRFRIWMKPSFIVIAICLALIPLALAWGQAAIFGLPYLPPVTEMKALIELVKPKPAAKAVAFFSFGESLYGGGYYDTQSLEDELKPECLLAYGMNGAPLPAVYGAPLRLRVENQLGYKMVKWIERIEFIESEEILGEGEGGSNEDHEYFDLLPNI